MLAAVLLFTATGAAGPSSLTAAPQVARAYDAIVDARFDEVPQILHETCEPPDPASWRTPPDTGGSEDAPGETPARASAEVCDLLRVMSLWWQIQLDPRNTSRDDAFSRGVDATIAAIADWTGREPASAEAWFYLGGAYGARAQWRVLRGERLAAARDGKRIKQALEHSLSLSPGLDAAYFGIGLYRYYADVAPAAARLLRWLLALPGGDRTRGLEEMLRAREAGGPFLSEADYQLHLIYLWYEQDAGRALELLHGLRVRHPHNPKFPQLVAEVEDVYLHDHAASLRTWERLLRSALARTVAEPDTTAARARLGMATEREHLEEGPR